MPLAGPNKNSMNQRGNGVSQGKSDAIESVNFPDVSFQLKWISARLTDANMEFERLLFVCLKWFRVPAHPWTFATVSFGAFILRKKWNKLVPKIIETIENYKSPLNFEKLFWKRTVCIVQYSNRIQCITIVKHYSFFSELGCSLFSFLFISDEFRYKLTRLLTACLFVALHLDRKERD